VGQVKRWAGLMGERRGECKVLVGKCEGRKALVRPKRRWDDNIEVDHREVGLGRSGSGRAGNGLL
jgi:hypothetical protein